MGQLRANIFLIRITSTYFWASEVLKVNYFYLPIHLANELWNFGIISIQKLICIPDNKI